MPMPIQKRVRARTRISRTKSQNKPALPARGPLDKERLGAARLHLLHHGFGFAQVQHRSPHGCQLRAASAAISLANGVVDWVANYVAVPGKHIAPAPRALECSFLCRIPNRQPRTLRPRFYGSRPCSRRSNGICYASSGEVNLSSGELQRMVDAVPQPIAAAMTRKAFYFVPLVVADGDQTLIADRYDVHLSDRTVCHRNLTLGDAQCVFISTRLMDDRFSVAFEFYINVAHAFADFAGFSQVFADLVSKQVADRVKGETSLDAHELRKIVTSSALRMRKKHGRSTTRRPSPTPSPSTCCRSTWTWTTTSCASATIRCFRLRPWPSACARWPSCFRRRAALSSTSSTSAVRSPASHDCQPAWTFCCPALRGRPLWSATALATWSPSA